MRSEAVEVHLRYKLENHLGQYESLGVLNTFQVASTILHSLYPLEEVEPSINSLAKEGFFEIYYKGKCEYCGKAFLIREHDNDKRSTYSTLMSVGEPCDGCLHCMHRPEVEVVYAIAQNRLEMTGYDSPREETFLNRILRWLQLRK